MAYRARRAALAFTASAVALAAGLRMTAANAQTPPAAGTGQGVALEEVVVTAQKRSERLAKVPLPVQAISGRQLERAGVQTVTGLVNLVPSASVVSSTSPGFDTIQIRGISSGTTGDSLVGYYLDDTPFGIPNLQLAPPSRLLDVQRVEVIRGPSGTIYGQGSMGGTVRLITNKPDLEHFSGNIGTEFSGTSGGGDNVETDFTVNVPILRDKLAVRVTGSYESLGGYAKVPELGLKDANGAELGNVRVEVRARPTDDVTLDGLYWHIQNSQDFNNNLTVRNSPAQLQTLLTGIYAAQGFGALSSVYAGLSTNLAFPVQPVGDKTIAGVDGLRAFTDTSADIYAFDVNWNTSIGTVTSNTSYIQHKLAFVAPVLGYLVNDSKFKTNSVTEELRLASDSGSAVRYLVGGFFRDATIHSDIDFYGDERIFFLPGQRLPLIDIVGPLHTRSYSFFGEVSTSLFDGLIEPLVGLRTFNDDRNAEGIDRATGLRSNTSANFSSESPRFNVKVNLSPDGIVYFNAAKGFRSGTLQTPAQVAEAQAEGIPANITVQPDELWTYELGTRWQLFDHTLAVEASIYRTDWSSIQIQFANSANSVSVVNGGDARIDGVDLAMRWKTPVPGLSVQLQGSVLDPEITRVNPGLSVATAIHAGSIIPNVPRETATASADYERSLPELFDSRLFANVTFAYRSSQADAATGLRSGDVRNLSLRAGLEKGPYHAEVFALNVLNDASPVVRTQFSYQILYPTQVGVRLGYSF